MSIFGRVQNLICEKLLNNSCSTISCKCTHFMNSVYRLIFDYHEDIMWDMFLIINQYFQALTNTCLVFTCKLCYGKLARLMLTIIVMYLLWAFISMLLWCKLHFENSKHCRFDIQTYTFILLKFVNCFNLLLVSRKYCRWPSLNHEWSVLKHFIRLA